MIKFTNRRGIASVIGGAVFLVLFISAFTVIIFAIQVTEDRFGEQLSASSEETLKGKEEFKIFPSVDNSDELYIDVRNQGSVQLNIVVAYVVNVDTGETFKYEINFEDARIAPNQRKAILTNYDGIVTKDFPSNPDAPTFEVKAVSELGTIATSRFTIGNSPFTVELYTIPRAIGTGQDLTIAMQVFNRGNSTIFNVFPADECDDMTNPVSAIFEHPSPHCPGPDPSDPVDLEPQESVLFTWEQTVIGAAGSIITYTNSAEGTDPASGDIIVSNTDSATVRFVPQAIGLLQQPDLLFTIPNPAGNSLLDGTLWGLNVVNPTPTAINLSRVVFNVLSNADMIVFKEDGCIQTQMIPTSGWDCPVTNVVQWRDTDTITLAPNDVQAFFIMSKKAENVNQSDPMSLVAGSTFSTFGPVTEVTLSTSTNKDGEGGNSVQIWISDDDDPDNNMTGAGVIDFSNVVPNLRNMCSGSTFDLNFVLSNSSNDLNAVVNDGTLAINIPPGFVVNSVIDQGSEEDDAVLPATGSFSASIETPVLYSDGSQQLQGTFTDLGGSSSENMVLTVNFTAPIATIDVVYVMFAVADGFIDNSAEDPPIGPLMQFPIHVKDINTLDPPCGPP